MPGQTLADSALALRIERATVEDIISCVESFRAQGFYPEADYIRVGGGVAAYFSPDNPVNGGFGLGMGRAVEQEEVAALAAFLVERGAPARLDVCPHADRSLLRWLATAGFVPCDFEMVLFQELPATNAPALAEGVEVGLAQTADEIGIWAEIEASGFTEGTVGDADRMLSRALASRAGALPFLGYCDGHPAGTGLLAMSDGIAQFNGDSTLSEMRNRGVQTSLLGERLRHASSAGCDLAVIEAAPGGISQRNQERAGFRHAYTRVTVELPAR